MNEAFRSEPDSIGPMQAPVSAYYGAQTARGIENFPISRLRFPPSFIPSRALLQ